MERNHAAALEARRKLCGRLGLAVPCPDAMIPTMASIPVPDGESTDWNQTMDFDPLHRALRETFHIEVPVFAWPAPPKRLLRVSAQVYNRPEEYDRLADALVRLLP